MACSAPAVGLLLALYGLATHYVSAARAAAPFRSAGWFDVRAEIGNVFYAAFANAREFGPHLFSGEWGAALTNLTNIAGIRSTIYTRVLHNGATNNAEAFMLAAPGLLVTLLIGRLAFALYRHRQRLVALWHLTVRRKHSPPAGNRGRRGLNIEEARRQEWRVLRFSADQALVYCAKVGLVSALATAMLLNTLDYYQGLSSLAGILGYFGSGIAKAVDMFVASSFALNEFFWHAVYAVTDGKDKALGWFTHTRAIEDLSHYLARFPRERIPAALHTAIYQAMCAGLIWATAHFFQYRLARHFVGRYDTLPPHMKRYLAARER
jgi:hypothetical protein